MLFALDIDGTIGQDTNHIARILTRDFQLPISEATLDQIDSLHAFLRLPAVKVYLEHVSTEERDQFRKAMKAASKHPDVQRNRIPMPGAVDALQELAGHGGKIIYTTCRQPESEQLTREWLARYGFPNPEQAYCCPHYHYKYLHAYEIATSDEPVVLIDDLVDKMILAFRALVTIQPETAKKLYRRLAVVAFACDKIPTFPVKIPFPVVTLKSWHPKDLACMRKAAQLR